MTDRIEREIEEILERLDDLPESGRSPIPIASRKKRPAAQPQRPPGKPLVERIDTPLLMISGAVVMIAGLVLAAIADAFIWLAFAGVVLFIAAFVFSLYRTRRPTEPKGASGVYWRDRYIEYEPAQPSAWARFTRRFRKR